MRNHRRSNAESDNQRRNAQDHRHPAALAQALFCAGIQQHDDEDEQHHDRPRIDDDLYGGDELRSQQQIKQRQRAHHDDERERAVDRVLLHQEVDRPSYAQRREDEEKYKSKHIEKQQLAIRSLLAISS